MSPTKDDVGGLVFEEAIAIAEHLMKDDVGDLEFEEGIAIAAYPMKDETEVPGRE